MATATGGAAPERDARLFEAAKHGDAKTLQTLLDADSDGLHARMQPYEMSLLHVAAQNGHLAAVDLLLRRGLDVNTREKGDNTYAMHWAAAAGHLDIVARLIEAGGDVVGHGDDHDLEVIGWATGWDGCDDATHRAIAALLQKHGARHNIFSAIAINSGEEVRQLVAADPGLLSRPMSENENFQLPLHFAVRKNRPEMVSLLLELGADPAATDGSGVPASVYGAAPGVGRPVYEALYQRLPADVFGALVLGDEATAERMVAERRDHAPPGDVSAGALHLMARRGDAHAVRWLLDHGYEPNSLWSHWTALVTPLHLAAMTGQAEVVRVLLHAGADPSIHDSMHDSDVMGWAEHGGQREIMDILAAHTR